jgi:hypothetical protein
MLYAFGDWPVCGESEMLHHSALFTFRLKIRVFSIQEYLQTNLANPTRLLLLELYRVIAKYLHRDKL